MLSRAYYHHRQPMGPGSSPQTAAQVVGGRRLVGWFWFPCVQYVQTQQQKKQQRHLIWHAIHPSVHAECWGNRRKNHDNPQIPHLQNDAPPTTSKPTPASLHRPAVRAGLADFGLFGLDTGFQPTMAAPPVHKLALFLPRHGRNPRAELHMEPGWCIIRLCGCRTRKSGSFVDPPQLSLLWPCPFSFFTCFPRILHLGFSYIHHTHFSFCSFGCGV